MQPLRFDLKTHLSQLIHNTASLWFYCITLETVCRGTASTKIFFLDFWTFFGHTWCLHLIGLDTKPSGISKQIMLELFSELTCLFWAIFAITFSQLVARWFVLDVWSEFFSLSVDILTSDILLNNIIYLKIYILKVKFKTIVYIILYYIFI